MNKTKITLVVLVVSLLVNVCGIVFTVMYFKLRSAYHRVSAQRDQLQNTIAGMNANQVPAETIGSMRISKRSFASLIDGKEDYYAVLPPQSSQGLDNTLVVYLHGMGSNYMEPFVYPSGNPLAMDLARRYPNFVLLSCNYRSQRSWAQNEGLADISQNIRELEQQYPIKKIVIMGASMGGCTSLIYAALAPQDIKEKIAGVVSAEGAGDLAKLQKLSESQYVQSGIIASMGGTPEAKPDAYRQHSFIPNIAGLPASIKVAVISAMHDTVAPPQLQEEIVQTLQKSGHQVELMRVDSAHAPPPSTTYFQALDFVLGSK